MSGSARAPKPLKLVTTWPDEAVETLSVAVKGLQNNVRLSLFRVEPRRLTRQVASSNCHILLLPPHDLLRLAPDQRTSVVAAVNLVISSPATTDDAPTEVLQALGRPAVLLPPAAVGEQVAFVADFCTLLCQGYAVITAFHNALTRLSTGQELVMLILPHDGNEAIWPQAPTIAANQSPLPDESGQGPPTTPAIAIGNAQFGGTMIIYKNTGDVVHGDQVKIARSRDAGSAMETGGDQVGGDQVKIVRNRNTDPE